MSDSNEPAYRFIITDGAKQDLVACRDKNRMDAARVSIFLRELMEENHYVERMIDTDFSDHQVENVVAVEALQKRDINGYRVKSCEWRKWRLIFIIDRPSARIGLFAVMYRDNNYPTILMDRIESEFDEHGFTRY